MKKLLTKILIVFSFNAIISATPAAKHHEIRATSKVSFEKALYPSSADTFHPMDLLTFRLR